MLLSLYDFYKDLKAKKILFCYSGPIAQSSIEGIGSTLRRNLAIEEAGPTASLSVFSIFIEQVQNVLNYSAEKLNNAEKSDDSLRVGIVVIGTEENGDYFVYCGNQVCNQDIPNLRKNIDLIRSLSKDELKTLYKERRRMEPELGGKSAGLGLIEMARKSGRPMEYSFIEIDNHISFFSIKAMVGRQSYAKPCY